MMIDQNNRWRKEKRAGARKSKVRMRDHYTKVLDSLGGYLKYSQALYDRKGVRSFSSSQDCRIG